jgi:hypothetical protein
VGTGGTLPGIKQPVRKVYHSLPSSAEIRKEWSYTSTIQYVFMESCLTSTTDKFYPMITNKCMMITLVRVIKSRRMRWVWHAARMEKMRYPYRIVILKLGNHLENLGIT